MSVTFDIREKNPHSRAHTHTHTATCAHFKTHFNTKNMNNHSS